MSTFPASMNSAFQRPIDCSETLSLRAASVIEISPESTASTIRVFFSGGISGDRPIGYLLDSDADHAPTTGLPGILKRDMLATGARNHEIARHLGLSEKTVRNHISTLLLKLQVSDRTAAAARDAGLGQNQPRYARA